MGTLDIGYLFDAIATFLGQRNYVYKGVYLVITGQSFGCNPSESN